ncbi:ARM repeat-containing protein [Ceraceosorus guamensis]|uniref:ARM repeat-containing protein n=1 Tax=Ceraceosorus guamensis TaxID=1522189 RepID=A0A316W2R1_9BASI|nr:ARM repeat-containing protein [Ceraceosorus guamensis]PWN44156.1 ARM repeat-containing protein [Ceraceosorus guamensis]
MDERSEVEGAEHLSEGSTQGLADAAGAGQSLSEAIEGRSEDQVGKESDKYSADNEQQEHDVAPSRSTSTAAPARLSRPVSLIYPSPTFAYGTNSSSHDSVPHSTSPNGNAHSPGGSSRPSKHHHARSKSVSLSPVIGPAVFGLGPTGHYGGSSGNNMVREGNLSPNGFGASASMRRTPSPLSGSASQSARASGESKRSPVWGSQPSQVAESPSASASDFSRGSNSASTSNAERGLRMYLGEADKPAKHTAGEGVSTVGRGQAQSLAHGRSQSPASGSSTMSPRLQPMGTAVDGRAQVSASTAGASADAVLSKKGSLEDLRSSPVLQNLRSTTPIPRAASPRLGAPPGSAPAAASPILAARSSNALSDPSAVDAHAFDSVWPSSSRTQADPALSAAIDGIPIPGMEPKSRSRRISGSTSSLRQSSSGPASSPAVSPTQPASPLRSRMSRSPSGRHELRGSASSPLLGPSRRSPSPALAASPGSSTGAHDINHQGLAHPPTLSFGRHIRSNSGSSGGHLALASSPTQASSFPADGRVHRSSSSPSFGSTPPVPFALNGLATPPSPPPPLTSSRPGQRTALEALASHAHLRRSSSGSSKGAADGLGDSSDGRSHTATDRLAMLRSASADEASANAASVPGETRHRSASPAGILGRSNGTTAGDEGGAPMLRRFSSDQLHGFNSQTSGAGLTSPFVPHAPLPLRARSPGISLGMPSGHHSPFTPSSPLSSPFHAPLPSRTPPPHLDAGLSESPPKVRSFIGMPPRSGYDLSDDPDDVGSEDGSTGSSRAGSIHEADNDNESEGEGEGEGDGDTGSEQGTDRRGADQDLNDAEERDVIGDSQNGGSDGVSGADAPPLGSAARPHLPKRPSLTRAAIVPPIAAHAGLAAHHQFPMEDTHTSAAANGFPADGPAGALGFFNDDDTGKMPGNHSHLGLQWSPGPVLAGQSAGSGGGSMPPPFGPTALGPEGPGGIIDAVDPSLIVGGSSQQLGNESQDQDVDMGTSGSNANPEQNIIEESLSTLERLFLFAKSEMTFHRVLVARSLADWIFEIDLSDAVEYVIPLLNGLGTDELEVCTVFTPELHRLMWFFFRNCPLVQNAKADAEQKDQVPGAATDADNDEEIADRPKLSVEAFTPLLCALLLNSNTSVAGAAQLSLVQLFARLDHVALRGPAGDTMENLSVSNEWSQDSALVPDASGREGERVPLRAYDFDSQARQMVKAELLENVAFAIGKLNAQDSTLRTGDQSTHAQGVSPSEKSSTPKMSDSKPLNGEYVDHEKTLSVGDADSRVSDQPAPEVPSFEMDCEADEDLQDSTSGDGSRGNTDETTFQRSSPALSASDNPDREEEAAVGRMASVSLLAALSAEGLLDVETLETRVVPEVVRLQSDGAFFVRKEVAIAVGSLAKHVNSSVVVKSLLPAFERFVQDDIWHVRQAVCLSIPAIFTHLDAETKRSRLLNALGIFTQDVSRNVRSVAFEIIGEAIYLFHKDPLGVPEPLIRHFLGEPFEEAQSADDHPSDPFSMEMDQSGYPSSDLGKVQAEETQQDNWSDDDMMNGYSSERWLEEMIGGPSGAAKAVDAARQHVMAYNFPAVVLTLGQERWPKLRAAHRDLFLASGTSQAQCSLAASLHEIAKVIGPEAASEDLVELFEYSMWTTEADVELKSAAVEHMDEFLQALPTDAAQKQLTMLTALWSSHFERDWRLRERLAQHISALARHHLLDDESGDLVTLMQLALSDPVSAVRDAAVLSVPTLYTTFAEHDQTVADGFLAIVADMGMADRYRKRLACVLAMHALFGAGIERSSVELSLIERMVELARDTVVDVRIALSRAVALACKRDELYASPQSRSPAVNEVLALLYRDASAEVREPMHDLLDEEQAQVLPEVQPVQVHARRDLTLGPADGGPHRPPRYTSWESSSPDALASQPSPQQGIAIADFPMIDAARDPDDSADPDVSMFDDGADDDNDEEEQSTSAISRGESVHDLLDAPHHLLNVSGPDSPERRRIQLKDDGPQEEDVQRHGQRDGWLTSPERMQPNGGTATQGGGIQSADPFLSYVADRHQGGTHEEDARRDDDTQGGSASEQRDEDASVSGTS